MVSESIASISTNCARLVVCYGLYCNDFLKLMICCYAIDDVLLRPDFQEIQGFLINEQDMMDFAKIGKLGYSTKSHASMELQISNRKLSESIILDNSSSHHSRTSHGCLDIDSRFATAR